LASLSDSEEADVIPKTHISTSSLIFQAMMVRRLFLERIRFSPYVHKDKVASFVDVLYHANLDCTFDQKERRSDLLQFLLWVLFAIGIAKSSSNSSS